MEEAHKKASLAESADELSKNRRITQVKESNFTKPNTILDNYLLSAFAINEAEQVGGILGWKEVCGIRHPFRTELWRFISNEEGELELGIAQSATDNDLNEDFLQIGIRCNKITLRWSYQNETVSVFCSFGRGDITFLLILNGKPFSVTKRNLRQMIARSDVQIRCPGSFLLNNFAITETEGMILGYRNRTEDVLRIFCSSLPHYIFSVIWDFAISDGLLSSKFICGFARLLDDRLENREQHWLKNVSLAISEIIDQFNSSETSYLLEQCYIKASDFKSLGQYAKEIFFSV